MPVNYFWDTRELDRSPYGSPGILAIGDSWFWYPMPGGSLVNHLGPMVAGKDLAILAKGMNGAEARDYVDGKYASQVRSALKLYGKALAGVFISGGGNDFAGFNDLRPLLKATCTAETTAPGCFKPGPDGVDGFFDQVDDYYRRLVGMVYTHTEPGCSIVMHTYDYARPSGKGVFRDSSWLRPALVDAGVKEELREACMRHLIDCFAAVLEEIRKTDPAHLFVVKSHGTLAAGDWANELHPTREGFARIAARWKPVLVEAGLAP